MRFLNIFILNLIWVVAVTAQPKSLVIDKDGINTFFDISPSRNYLIYGKNLKGFDSGDYIEGQVFIYNRITNSHDLLNKDTLEISSTIYKWGKNDNTLFFFDGRVIYYISIENEIVVKPIYTPENEYMRIDNFFISKNDKKIACWISNNNPNEATKDLVIIDLEKDFHKTFYSVKNEWLPEFVTSVVEWVNDDSIVFINMYGNLFLGNLLIEEIVQLKDSINTDFLKVNNAFVFYCRNDKFIMYNISNGNENILLEANSLNINYLTINMDNSLVVSINDKIIHYNGHQFLADILHTSNLKAKVVFCDSHLFIEEEINNSNKMIVLYEY